MRLASAVLVALACTRFLSGAQVPVEPTPAGVAGSAVVAPSPGSEAIKARLSVIEAGVTGLQEATARNSATSSETVRALTGIQRDVAALREAIEQSRPAGPVVPDADAKRAQERLAARLMAIESLLKSDGDIDGTALGYPRLAVVLAGLAAVLSLGAIASLIWLRPRSGGAGIGSVERRLNEIKETLAKADHPPAGKGDKSAKAGGENGADPATNALRAAAEASAREAKAVTAVVAQLQSLSAGLQPAVESLTQQTGELEVRRVALAEEQAALTQAKAEIAAATTAQQEASATARQQAAAVEENARAVAGQLALYEKIWPEALRGEGPLAAAKEALLEGVVAGNSHAAALINALIAWHVVRTATPRDREQWIAAALAVGRASLAFQAQEPSTGEAEALEQAQAWTRTVKTGLEEAFPALRLNAVYVGDRFDSDRMEAVSSISGGRQSVRQALSWSVLEKAADSTRVLQRAEVITA